MILGASPPRRRRGGVGVRQARYRSVLAHPPPKAAAFWPPSAITKRFKLSESRLPRMNGLDGRNKRLGLSGGMERGGYF